MAKKKEVGVEVALRQFHFMMPELRDPLVQEVDKYAGVVSISIEDSEGERQISQELVGIKTLIKKVEEKKASLLGPIKEQVIKPIEAWLKPMAATLKRAEEVRKAALGVYKTEQEEMREAIAELEAKSGGALMVVEEELVLEGGKVSLTPKLVFEVENASLVPEDIVRAAVETTRGKEALREVIRARIEGGIRKIPGVRVGKDYQVSVTVG